MDFDIPPAADKDFTVFAMLISCYLGLPREIGAAVI